MLMNWHVSKVSETITFVIITQDAVTAFAIRISENRYTSFRSVVSAWYDRLFPIDSWRRCCVNIIYDWPIFYWQIYVQSKSTSRSEENKLPEMQSVHRQLMKRFVLTLSMTGSLFPTWITATLTSTLMDLNSVPKIYHHLNINIPYRNQMATYLRTIKCLYFDWYFT